jgi:hypothetical protein
MFLKSACLTDDALSGQKQNFQFWDYLQVLDYQNFQTSDVTLKEFCWPIFVDKY